LAQARSPVRAFSIATISVVLTGSILVAVIPDVESVLPGHGLFGAAAAVVFLCVVTAVGVRPVRRALAAAGRQCRRRAEAEHTRGSREVPVIHGSRISGAWVALVVTMLMAAVGNFAVWTFVEEIGISLGMAEATTIRLLGVTQIIGLAGALVAAASGGRFRRVSLLPPALLLLAAGNLAIGLAGSPVFFIGGMIAVNVAFYCLNPLLFAKAAQLDPVGRLAAVVGGASLAGSFIAPVVGGFLAGSDNQWARLSWTAALVILLALGPATFALRGVAGDSRRVGMSEG
ncbi:MAG: hypothetical protein Q8P61_04460, partial [Candidatus Nanopelagicales bacterium]|nr:hypothetical protein [Candidatus Nanopelagicales bacterium]